MRCIKKVSVGIITPILLLLTLFTAGVFTPMQAEANDIGLDVNYFDTIYGEVNSSGVDGYTTEYLMGGEKEVQWNVQKGWHIQTGMSYYEYGITWYYCVDSDDGDVYGWIDGEFLTFYSSNPVETYYVDYRQGQVNTHGGSVDGYTTSYVCNGGAKAVEHHVQNGWHITALTYCESYGVRWYECWDTDDGDYYGWIDADYIDFYDEMPVTEAATPEPTVEPETEEETETQPAETVIVEKTVIVTEYVTEPETTETTDIAAAAVTENSESGSSPFGGTFVIILIAAIILLLIAIAVLLIVILTKKSKAAPQPQVHQYQQPVYSAEPFYCEACGAARANPADVCCRQCGYNYYQD